MRREGFSGIAEAVKVALIKDRQFFDFISHNAKNLAARDTKAMEYLIYRCCQLHLDHIADYGDPFEMGSSRPLDFGHWAAHKLEHLTDYRLRHGEAVAIGMALDCTLSDWFVKQSGLGTGNCDLKAARIWAICT